MSLQNLQLPAEVITDLYTYYLVEPMTSPKTEKKKDDIPTVASLGGNARAIAILIADPSQTFMNDIELEWLQKMLQACKLTLGDVAIVNTHSKNFSIAMVKQQLKPRKMLLLGPSPTELQLPLNFPQFKIQEHDHCSYVYAPGPKELNLDTQEGKILRTKLWVTLKQLFEV
jgi:hypothetical protein